MSEQRIEKKKQVIGLFGEMQLSMRLHELGWQVHRAYIDEGIDFTITRYWCSECNKYSQQFIRYKNYRGKNVKCVTNLCEHCQQNELSVVSKYLQVKTSEGVPTTDSNIRMFSFHPKIRYDVGSDVFYVWIAVFDSTDRDDKFCHFYIFNTADVKKFDNTDIDTYQITDNQKTSLRIDTDGRILNQGRIYNFKCFNESFFNNFSALEKI
jgi:hypothetical protein